MLHYKTYSEHLREIFGPGKVQKISINAGLGCPNRDGTIGHGGCTYCSNASFTPAYCLEARDALRPGGVAAQLARGREFFSRKYPTMRYLAYFQSYTSTFIDRPQLLRDMYEEAVSQPGVLGLVIGTRPDCLPDPVIEILADLTRQTHVTVELGAESSHDRTLQRVNRGHTWGCVTESANRLSEAGIEVGLHLIAGLPGEAEPEVLETVRRAVTLPVSTLKLHQLQVIRGTGLHRQFLAGEADIVQWDADRYMRLCAEVVKLVPRHIAIERFLASAPPEMVVSPKWGLKNHEFTDRLHNFLRSIEV